MKHSGLRTSSSEINLRSSRSSSSSSSADIGRPDFKLQVSDDKKKTTLYVEDPLTAIFKDGRQLNIRDVFSDQLLYRVTYRRNKSTGRVSNGRL